MDTPLHTHLEAILFYKSEPVSKKELAGIFSVNLEELQEIVTALRASLIGRGIQLVETDTEMQLVTTPEVQETIDRVRKEELTADIGKAGAETLAIVLYRGPISRAEIDRIRGVNSNFILRNLLVRGLIERRSHPTDSRSFTYAITPTLLNHLGIANRESLPEFGEIMNALDLFEKQEAEADQKEQNPFISG